MGGLGTDGIAAAASRRWASAACMVNASSHLSRLRAWVSSARSCGRWIALIASSLGHRSYFSRTSAGIGSSPASSLSRTASIAREIRHELSLALAG